METKIWLIAQLYPHYLLYMVPVHINNVWLSSHHLTSFEWSKLKPNKVLHFTNHLAVFSNVIIIFKIENCPSNSVSMATLILSYHSEIPQNCKHTKVMPHLHCIVWLTFHMSHKNSFRVTSGMEDLEILYIKSTYNLKNNFINLHLTPKCQHKQFCITSCLTFFVHMHVKHASTTFFLVFLSFLPHIYVG